MKYYEQNGEYIPDGGMDELKKYDGVLFGFVGVPDVPDHLSLTALRLASTMFSTLIAIVG